MVVMNTKEKIESYSKSKTETDMIMGFEHFARVYAISKRLAITARINYDDEILHAACFLHEIETEEPRARLSAKKARKFLDIIDFPKEKIDAVIDAIKSQNASLRPEAMEAKLLHDAELMEFLGAIGAIRISAACAAVWKKKSMTGAIESLNKYKDISFNNLMFKESKEMAKDKMRIMEELITQAEKEMV